MKRTLPLAALGLLGLAAAPALDQFSFGPEEGTTLTKTFETTMDMALDDLMVNFNGQDMDPAMMGMDMSEASVTVSIMVEVEDEYGPSKDGRPTTLVRRFETLSADFEAGDGQSDSKNDDDLEGATLTFTWNDEEGSYDVSSDDEDMDLTEISHGAEDMDMRAGLPAGEVEEGDTWKLEGRALLSVLWPGVDWANAQEQMKKGMEDNPIPVDVEELFDELMKKAVVTCTYAGTREVDGVRMQIITMESEIEHDMDLGETIMELIRAEAPTEVDMSLDANVELAAQLTGEMIWDSAAGHFRECVMDIELAMLADFDGEAEMQGTPVAGSAEVEASGVLRRRATAR